MAKSLTEYALYRWRFIIGYTVAALIIAGFLLIAALYVPGGISHEEMLSSVESSRLSLSSLSPDMAIQAPYHALQKLSTFLLGVSLLSIKLPSIVLGMLSIAGTFILLSFWFRKNVAVLTTILVITTGQVLFLVQNGTPAIMYIFWPVALLVAATLLARRIRGRLFWLLMLGAGTALSLYTPLSLYIVVALVTAGMLHPHVRYTIRRLPWSHFIAGGVIFLLIAAPLAYALIREPRLGLELLGIPATWPPDWQANAIQLVKQYADFLSPDTGLIMLPVYGLGSLALIVLGALRLMTTKYTARSYMITAWVIFLVPVLLLNPTYTSITFVPALILMGMGVEELVRSWYKLFPLNPYARFIGLLPLTILIGGMMLSGTERYLYGYHYDPNSAGRFNDDITLVRREVARAGGETVTLITPRDTHAFYDTLRATYTNLTVTTNGAVVDGQAVVLRGATADYQKSTVNRIVTSRLASDSDRLYVYNSDAK